MAVNPTRAGVKVVTLSPKEPKIKEVNFNSVPKIARGFISGKPDFPITNKYKILANTDILQEICFPQYSRPWNGARSSLPLTYFSESRQILWNRANPTNTKYNEPYRYAHGFAVAPVYLKLAVGKRNKRITCDYALHLYSRDDTGSKVNKDNLKLRLWVHTELLWDEQEQRHRFDSDKSWLTSYYLAPISGPAYYGKSPNSKICGTIHFRNTFGDADPKSSDRIVLFPWTHLSSLDRAPNAVWYSDLKKRISKFVQTHIQLLPPQVRTVTRWNGINLSHKTANQYKSSFGVQLVITENCKEFIKSKIEATLPKEKFKALEKFGFRLFKDCINRSSMFDNMTLEGLAKILPVLSYYVNHFDDPSFLHHVDYDGIIRLIVSSRYWDIKPRLVKVLNDDLFKKFPRSKQYRMVGESIFDPAYYVEDLERMIKTIHEHPNAGPGTVAEVIDTRDIKNFQDYHDQVVKVYNKIRYAPKPINQSIFQFVIDAGLDIPDTSLRMVLPEDTNVIREWGATQNHCLGTYADNCYNGIYLIMGVWDDDKAEWAGHIQAPAPKPEYFKEWRNEKAKTVTQGPTMVNQGYQNGSNATYTYTYGSTKPTLQINQFYAKRNTPVDPDSKKAVIDHLNKALQDYAAQYLDTSAVIQLMLNLFTKKAKLKTNA